MRAGATPLPAAAEGVVIVCLPQKASSAPTLPAAASAFMSLCTPPSPPELTLKLPSDELRKLLVGTPLRLSFRPGDCPAMCVDEPDQVGVCGTCEASSIAELFAAAAPRDTRL